MLFFGRKNKNKNMDLSYLKVGVDVEIYSLDQNSLREPYRSKIEKIISNKEIVILAPMVKGKIVKLSEHIKYGIVFKTRSCIFKSVIKVKDYFIKDGICFIKICTLEETKKLQRRQCFRLSTKVQVNFDIVDRNDEEVFFLDEPLLSTGITEDISSGGMKFLSNEELEIDKLIKCEFILNNKPMITIGKVLFMEELEKSIDNKYEYCYKVRFEAIQREDKEFISKYIFNEQIVLSKKVKLS